MINIDDKEPEASSVDEGTPTQDENVPTEAAMEEMAQEEALSPPSAEADFSATEEEAASPFANGAEESSESDPFEEGSPTKDEPQLLNSESEAAETATPENDSPADDASSESGSAEEASSESSSQVFEVDVPVDESLKAAPASAAKEEAAEESSEEKSEEEEEEEEPPLLKELPPEQAALPWYVVHTYSGYEQLVKANLEERIRQQELEDSFGNIVVPQEKVVELVRGKKKTSSRKFFPGYIMVQMDLNDHAWHAVNGTPKVTGFVGDERNPSPLTQEEVDNLLAQMQGGGSRPRLTAQFSEGDSIKVIDGPFADFNGTVDEVKPEKGKLRVLISIFGRNTPVELDFIQVEKV